MELTAKIASLEDEVKLLKGEVKLILSEIRTAILGQDNPFAEPGQALRSGAIDSRPPIRVVRVPAEDEEPEVVEPQPEPPTDTLWGEAPEGPAPQPMASEEPPEPPLPEEQPPAPQPKPIMKAPTAFVPPPPPITPRSLEPEPAPQPGRPVTVGTPRWSLITVAGLAVWAEEALKQIGPKRLRILLDLCEFTGYVSGDTKGALLKVTSLSRSTEERKTAPSTNECLVVLCQLDALLRGDQPAGLNINNPAAKWQQTA